MCITNDLKNIERAFLALPNEGVLPKDSVIINAIKWMLKPECNCTLIGHVISSNFDESLSTLQFIERCKAEMASGDKGGSADTMGANASDQMLRNLKQINEEYKTEIELT